MKPLFIPLKTEYYRLFENGYKTHEYRQYGPRWNEDTCIVGRLVTLSRGYSTPDRLQGRVIGFQHILRKDLPTPQAYNAWMDCYDTVEVADIEIEIIQ